MISHFLEGNNCNKTRTTAFENLLGELDQVETTHSLSLSLEVYLSAEHSPKPPPSTPSRAHCMTRPYLVPFGQRNKQCFVTGVLVLAWIKTKSIKIKWNETMYVVQNTSLNLKHQYTHICIVCGMETILFP